MENDKIVFWYDSDNEISRGAIIQATVTLIVWFGIFCCITQTFYICVLSKDDWIF